MVGKGLARGQPPIASQPDVSANTCHAPASSTALLEQYNTAVKKFYALRETLRFEQGQLAATNRALLNLHNLSWNDATIET